MKNAGERFAIACLGAAVGCAGVLAWIGYQKPSELHVTVIHKAPAARPVAGTSIDPGTLVLLSPSVAVGAAVNGDPAIAITPAPSTAAFPEVAEAVTRAEQRAAANTWPGLTQLEVNHLQMILQDVAENFRGAVTIFCANDAYCGDLQLDFDNVFETSHWPAELEKPIIDKTVGITTSSPTIKEAIETATRGRLKVAMIPKNAPYFALVIGKKPKG